MSGHQYPTSKATQEALEDNVKAIAAAKGCTVTYIYSVASGGDKDPFIDFLEKWFVHVAEGNPTGARAYPRHLTDIILKFENNTRSTSNKPITEIVAEIGKAFLAFMACRDRQEPEEKQRALLIPLAEAVERASVSLDGEIKGRNLNAA